MKKYSPQTTVAVRFMRLLLPLSVLSVMPLQPSLAEESENISEVKDCRAIAADAERLRCYDTTVEGGVHNEKQSQLEQFGKPEKPAEPATDQVSVTIVRIQTRQDRKHYFHTADGAVWEQTGRGSWNLAVPFDARIKKGALSSYFLVAEGGKATRVKRVR